MLSGHRSEERHGAFVPLVALACCLALAAGLLLAGCGESPEDKYRAEWKNIVEKLIDRINADDKKAEQLAAAKDYAGVVKLVNERINGVEATMGTVIALKPPKSLRKLHALTLYFMVALVDQLTAQNDLNKANLSGQPTGDLQTKVKNLQDRVLSTNQELVVEQLSQGIIIKQPGQKEKPQGSTPQSAPSPVE